MQFNDDKLVNSLKGRNQDALKYVIDEFIDSVYGVARSILNGKASSEDIEECVQDVFVDVWNNIEKYDGNRGSLKTWILIQCKYKALSISKAIRNKNNLIQLEELELIIEEDFEQELLIKENKEEILKIINSFNKKDKEIFLRRYFLEERIEDICSLTNLTRQAIDNRLWRGRKIIKDKFNIMEGRGNNE